MVDQPEQGAILILAHDLPFFVAREDFAHSGPTNHERLFRCWFGLYWIRGGGSSCER